MKFSGVWGREKECVGSIGDPELVPSGPTVVSKSLCERGLGRWKSEFIIHKLALWPCCFQAWECVRRNVLLQSMMIRSCSHLLPLYQASHSGLVRTLKISGRDINCNIQFIMGFSVKINLVEDPNLGYMCPLFTLGHFLLHSIFLTGVRSLVCGVD